MNLIFPSSPQPMHQLQARLMQIAAVFMLIYSVTLTLSPAVRYHSLNVVYRWDHWIGFIVWMAGFIILHRTLMRRIPDCDPYILPLTALLSGWGLLTIWRLNANFGMRQTIWLAFGMLVLWAGTRFPKTLQLLRRYKYFWLTCGLLLTALTFIFGTYPGGIGPQLWLGCCGVYLQPSEPLKLLLIVYLAAYMADQLALRFHLLQLLAPTVVLLGATLGILVAQRDLGTASLFLVLYFAIIYIASGQKKIPIIAGGALLSAGLTGYFMFDVIRLRIDAWLNPWLDPSGRSYQIVQSIMAVSAGKILGRGPGLGSPGVVPVAHSDFIFAAISEEMGLIGAIAMLFILAILVNRGLLISLRAVNNYQRYLASGLTIYLALQSILIIGGNIRMLPLTGVTLPFVSYGGSSLLTAFLAVTMLLIISSQFELQPAPITNHISFQWVGGLLLVGLAILAMISGWWSLIRADELLTRADNPRRSINDRFVLRGDILDRNNQPIVVSQGDPGNYSRENLFPATGMVIGYTNPVYGQAGLELSLDPYLRGIKGTPASTIWSYEMLYGQTPPGLDVRLSLDINLQENADALLGDHKGALVLLNAKSGEILALASHPYFNPNELESKFSSWVNDPESPLLNRATQGQYPPGASLGPFLLASNINHQITPSIPSQLSYNFKGTLWKCTSQPQEPVTWSAAIANGCPQAVLSLGQTQTSGQLLQLYRSLGFTQTPNLPLPSAEAMDPFRFTSDDLAILGQSEISVTPVQMAIAAATLGVNGMRPSPLLATAVKTPSQGWIVLPGGNSVSALPQTSAGQTAQQLASPDAITWSTVAYAQTPQGPITWFVGGTLPSWKGTPMSLAVVLEEDNPTVAQEIGSKLLLNPILP